MLRQINDIGLSSLARPLLVKPLTQVNTTDAVVSPGGSPSQAYGQVVDLADGGYLVVWTDFSAPSTRPGPQ